MKRILGAIRLSDYSDESTSPQRQREIITNESLKRTDNPPVGWAEDLDVSASKISPFDRPGLGVWLTDEGAAEWDEMIFWRLDRVARSVKDFADLIKWCDERGKNLVSATEPIDLSSQWGRMLAYLVAMFAEMEAKAISERVTGSHGYLRKNKRWAGGSVPYGYAPEQIPTGGWKLVIHPETEEVVRELVDRVLAGESMNGICKDLNERGVLTPRDWWETYKGRQPKKARHWGTQSIKPILGGRGILGEAVHEDRVVCDEDGLPLKRAEPIASRAEWDDLQLILANRSYTRTRSHNTSMLLNVAYCMECGKPLYLDRYGVKGKLYAYYKCRSKMERAVRVPCETKSIPLDLLEDRFEDQLLYEVGNLEAIKTITRPSIDRSGKIAEIDESLRQADDDRANGAYRGAAGDQRYLRVVNELQDRREALVAQSGDGNRVEERPMGLTIRDAWESSDGPGRRRLMIDAGIKVLARRKAGVDLEGDGLETRIVLPEGYERRLQQLAARRG